MRINILGWKIGKETEKGSVPQMDSPPEPPVKQALFGGGVYNRVWAVRFDGEKNLGEMGPIRKLVVDHNALRLRSWQLYLESEVCQTVFHRTTTWVIGNGLKLQAEPSKDVLAGEKINIQPEEFNKTVEARFRVYGNSTMADYANQQNLHEMASDAFINSIVGGDVLVVLRLIGGTVKVQLIDGAHVATPLNLPMQGVEYIAPTGNRVRHGVEIDAQGQHVAYHVCSSDGLNSERIPARGTRSGALMAYMVYGLKYRLDNLRGLPLISAVMETAKKMERYKEATLGSAEERAKIVLSIEHDAASTGESPFLKRLAEANGFPSDDLAVDVNGKVLTAQVAATTNKQAVNMPPGAKLTSLESDNELHFRDFFSVNIDLVCATVGIPPEVALSKYDSNYSASRAAIKDWEHSLNVKRKRFADKFYQAVYNLWLEVQVLSNKISAPGYLAAKAQRNEMAIAAYQTARFVGASVPHIDPLKEVLAERAKLGAGSEHIPLTTVEAATEVLNGGDSASNMAQYAEELKKADGLGIEKVEPKAPVPPGDEDTPPPPKKKDK